MHAPFLTMLVAAMLLSLTACAPWHTRTHQLALGMTKDEVRSTLGTPGTVSKNVFVESWKYRLVAPGRTIAYLVIFGPDDTVAGYGDDDQGQRRIDYEQAVSGQAWNDILQRLHEQQLFNQFSR